MHSDIAVGIRFNDCFFTQPMPLVEWQPPQYAGLFVILARDPNWAPKPFQPLYFGEFGNNARDLSVRGDSLVHLDVRRSAELYVATLPMPFSTTSQRCTLRDQLLWAYNPVFQAHAAKAPAHDLARKVEELEKRHQEQSAQFGLLLASINRFFEPLPERPHRPIGFLPSTA
ncbi:MAG TPA: hypothetical protein VLY24_07465 [Bryobacteraceae bacterium]|nr:hypothetical protein [Bryobacteraceae bacterium]